MHAITAIVHDLVGSRAEIWPPDRLTPNSMLAMSVYLLHLGVGHTGQTFPHTVCSSAKLRIAAQLLNRRPCRPFFRIPKDRETAELVFNPHSSHLA